GRNLRDHLAAHLSTRESGCGPIRDVTKGDGKGWARGRTAATDGRVAHAAAGHKGKHYVRRAPISRTKAQRGSAATSLPVWSAELAYIVGLTASDGCLLTARPAINFTSKDRDLVELYLQLLGRTNTIGTGRSGSGA